MIARMSHVTCGMVLQGSNAEKDTRIKALQDRVDEALKVNAADMIRACCMVLARAGACCYRRTPRKTRGSR